MIHRMAPFSMTLNDLWPTFQGHDHRLHGSASTVLTATSQVNGRWQIVTLTESKPMNRLQQNSAHLITSARGPLNQIWYKSIHWGLLGIWVKYNVSVHFLFIPFFWDSRTGQTGRLIFTRDSSLDVKSRKDVPFGGLNDVPLNFGGKTPQKLKFWGRE